jgi:hypothetical protein
MRSARWPDSAGPAPEVTRPSTAYRRIADSGNAIRFHFCPTCGSTVSYQSED